MLLSILQCTGGLPHPAAKKYLVPNVSHAEREKPVLAQGLCLLTFH